MGKALRFYASQRIFLSKYKIKADDPITEEEGIKVKAWVKKNRLATGQNPYRECFYYARYGEGIDNMATMPLLLTRTGVIRVAGAWMYYENENGEVIPIGDKPGKWNGKNALLDDLKNNKLVFETLQGALNKKLGLSEGVSVDPDIKEELEKEDTESQLPED